MKKVRNLLLLLLTVMYSNFVLADSWDGVSSDVSWFNENIDVYKIRNAAQLKGFSDLVKGGNSFEGKTIYLMNDIDLGIGHVWKPIGANDETEVSFMGTFDGQNHSVSNVNPTTDKENKTSDWYLGLFGRVGDMSVIRNLHVFTKITITNESRKSTMIKAGGIAGRSDGVIEHSEANVLIETEGSYGCYVYAGGICGMGNILRKVKSTGDIDFTKSSDLMHLANYSYIGGIAGCAERIDVAYTDCNLLLYGQYSIGIGGIAGRIQTMNDSNLVKGIVSNTLFEGNLVVSKVLTPPNVPFVGGIVGHISCDKEFESVCNIVSPKYINYEYSAGWLGPLFGVIESCNRNIVNNYYSCLVENNYSSYGQYVDEESLKNKDLLSDFDDKIWSFADGKLPSLKDLDRKYYVYVPLEYGKIAYSVNEGAALNLKILADEGYSVNKVYYGDEDITNYLQGEELVIDNIISDGDLKFVFIKDSETSIYLADANKPNLVIEGKSIYFKGLSGNERVLIYNLEGKLVESYLNNMISGHILVSGTYIVKVGKYIYKIAI